MIDLAQSQWASPTVHTVAVDPGTVWTKDGAVAIEAPPETDIAPLPEAQWSPDAPRNGVCGAVGSSDAPPVIPPAGSSPSVMRDPPLSRVRPPSEPP